MNLTEALSHPVNVLYPLLVLVKPFDTSAALGIFAVLLLLFLSGMISGSEIAYFSLNPKQIDDLRNSDKRSDKLVLKHLDKPQRLLATILISNNFVNIAIVLTSAWLTEHLFDFGRHPVLGFLLQVVVITLFILLFGEILPKIYARQKAMSFVRVMATPLQNLQTLFNPLSALMVNFTQIIDHRMQKRKNSLEISELSEVVDITHSDKGLQSEEAKILKSIATFGDKEVSEIMKARVDVAAVEKNTPFSELLAHIKEWGYSRIPVYIDDFDHVEGILYIKDLLPHLANESFDWQKLIRPAFYIPENKKINDLLQEFKKKKIHLALVVDEYGGTSGIVTLEDVLEEIVGEISDEFDVELDDLDYKKLTDNSWVFEAKTSLIDVCKIMELNQDFFDEIKGESDSLAGLLLEIKGDFPEINEILQYKNIKFEVLMMDERRIKRIKVVKLSQQQGTS